MVWGSSDYVANLGTVNNEDDCSRPQYQMVRISMIKQGSDALHPNGFAVADGKIVNNPITIQNTNVANKFDSENPLGFDQIRQLMSPQKYQAGDTSIAHRLNTRRDYLSRNSSQAILGYGMKWVPNQADNPATPENEALTGGGHYELDIDKGAHYIASPMNIYMDDSLPLLIDGGGSYLSKYQQTPPSGFEYWSTLGNREFFSQYTQSSFLSEEAKAAGLTTPVPEFSLRVLARMMENPNPYSPEVLDAYNTYLRDGNNVLLVEPLQVFENTTGADPNEQGIIEVLFGETVKYVALSAAEVAVLDDNSSGINYGYTGKANKANKNYNWFSSPESPTAGAIRNLYNSQLLSLSEWKLGLKSLSDGVHNGSNLGALDQFKSDINSSGTNQNFYNGTTATSDFGSALNFGKTDSTGGGESALHSSPYWGSIFYYQVYKDIFNSTNYNGGTAKSKLMGSQPDPASLSTFGGMSIIKPNYDSKIDIKTSLTGVGPISKTVTNSNGEVLPVYEQSNFSETIYDENGDVSLGGYTLAGSYITFKAGMELNFDNGATDWRDKVATDINNAGINTHAGSSKFDGCLFSFRSIFQCD